MAVTGVGGFSAVSQPLIASLSNNPARRADGAPAPNQKQVEAPAPERPSDPVHTDRPGGAPFHAGGPTGVTVQPERPGSAPILTARPVEGPKPPQNAVLEQVQNNHTEMVGLLLDRFA